LRKILFDNGFHALVRDLAWGSWLLGHFTQDAQ
jgi:hypothetical protein